MSDELDIRGGGAVAVDTATLRSAASGFASIAVELTETAAVVGSAALQLFGVTEAMLEESYTVETARRRILSAVDAADDIADALRSTAAVYEVVELRAERAAANAAGDAAAVARIDGRLSALSREHPEAADQATRGAFLHWLTWPAERARQAPGVLWWLAPGMHTLAVPLAWAGQQAIGSIGAGTVSSGARLVGGAKEVAVVPLPTRGPTGSPASLADAAARVPGGGEARIRVERYTMSDGSRQFAVYVAGTQTASSGTREAFDMGSNVELYTGGRSVSFDATLAALSAAGAEKGDVVHAFGHSQGAMVAAHVALEGGFDTRTLVSFGSPIEADVGAQTLSVSLRHTDDPIAALAGGGHPGAVGAPGSFIAERTADPPLGLHDLRIPAHGIDGYAVTARLLDESPDPRMAAVREVFIELAGAASVEVREYSAERVVPVPRPRSGPAPISPTSSDAG